MICPILTASGDLSRVATLVYHYGPQHIEAVLVDGTRRLFAAETLISDIDMLTTKLTFAQELRAWKKIESLLDVEES